MVNFYPKKGLKIWLLAAGMLLSAFAWAQTAVVTSIPVPTGSIAAGSDYNTIYGFKVDVGFGSNIQMQNLTVNFTGTFPQNVVNVQTLVYQGQNTPFDPDGNYWSSKDYGYLSTTGGTNIISNWGQTLYAGETYYFFVQANFYQNGTTTGVGTSISAAIPSLSAIKFTASNPVTITGSVTAGSSYDVITGIPIITPLSIPSKTIPIGNAPFPILGYKIECPSNILSYVFQDEIVVTISGTYDTSIDGIDLRFYSNSTSIFDYNNSNSYTSQYSLSGSGSEELVFNTYSREIYRGKPSYVFLTAFPYDGLAGNTIKATLDPAKSTPSLTGSVIVGNVFTLSKPVPTLTVPSAFNTNTEMNGQYVYGKLYTFGITAPVGSDLVLSSFNLSLSGVDNALNSFGSGYFYLTSGMIQPSSAKTSSELNNLNFEHNSYYNFITTETTSGYTFEVNGGEIIPAGQTRYFTLAAYSYISNNAKLQVLSIESINNATFTGVSAVGGILTKKSYASFTTVNSILGTNISPYGEQLVYAFNGSSSIYYYTFINNLVVTLTGNLDYNNISEVRLRAFTNNENSDTDLSDFTNASNFATVYNPTSNVIQFSGQGGYMYYDRKGESKFFITVELKNGVDASVVGQNVGVAKIENSAITLGNYWTNPALISIDGTNLTAGTSLTYSLPSVAVTTNELTNNNLLGTNQSITPIYSAKLVASGGVPIATFSVTTTGTYTSNEITGFYLYGSDRATYDSNSGYLDYTSASSTGSGENLTFTINENAPAGTNYLYIVPEVANTTVIGKTVKINAIPASAFVLSNNAISKTVTLGAGSTYTLVAPSITFTCTPSTIGKMPKSGYFKAYSVEVNSNVAFTLNSFAFKTNGYYNYNGLGDVYTYFSYQPISNWNDDFDYIDYWNDNSSIDVITNSGEVFNLSDGGIDISLPSGKSYITIFMESNSNGSNRQSFGVAGLETNITTVLGSTITYVNNVASVPTTVLGQILTLTSIALDNSTIYRGNNQLLYKAKFISNVSDYFDYFGIWVKGVFLESDFRNSDPKNSFKVFLSTSSTYAPYNSTNIADPANGASYVGWYGDWFEFYNYSLRLEANTPYYIYVAVDIAPTATIGNKVRVYGEDEGELDNEFQFEPDGNYDFDYVASKMEYGNEMVIIDGVDPAGTTESTDPSSVVLYPNPSTGVVKIQGDFDTATVYDAIGAPVVTSTVAALDLSGVNDGLYFVKITKGNATSIKKIVIKK